MKQYYTSQDPVFPIGFRLPNARAHSPLNNTFCDVVLDVYIFTRIHGCSRSSEARFLRSGNQSSISLINRTNSALPSSSKAVTDCSSDVRRIETPLAFFHCPTVRGY